MSQGIAQQCNDILVLGDLRNGSKLSNYSASSPPICKHDFARRSASASAKSLSVSVNGQGVSRGVGTSESLVIACVRFESCLSPRLRVGSHRARGHSPPLSLDASAVTVYSLQTKAKGTPEVLPWRRPSDWSRTASPLRTRPCLRQATWRGRGRRLRGPGVGPRFFGSPYAPLRVTRRWAKRRP